jgi:peptide methionine sulfoxide reductase MsrB
MKLTPEQYYVLRKRARNDLFTGEYVDNHERAFTAVPLAKVLFTSETKFDSGSGWAKLLAARLQSRRWI